MAYCEHKKGRNYMSEEKDWETGYNDFIGSENPWAYDFSEGKEQYLENTDCEQSILSQFIFIKLFSKYFPSEIDKYGLSITVGKRGEVCKDFLFDIMHNPKSGCQPCQQAKYLKYNNGKMKFESIYHTLGNFAPVPRTVVTKNLGPRLQQIHLYLNELWPNLLKFLQDNWECFPTKVHKLLSFKKYMLCTCQQMYFNKIFNKIYDSYKKSGNKDEIWGDIIEELKGKSVEDMDTLISFNDLFDSKENIAEIDNRIQFLIELRGRYIISMLKDNQKESLPRH